MKVKVTQLCPTLCDPMDYTVHGILQAKILEWVAFPWVSQTQGQNPGFPHCRQILYQLNYKGSPNKKKISSNAEERTTESVECQKEVVVNSDTCCREISSREDREVIWFGKTEVIGDLDLSSIGKVTVAEAPVEWIKGRMWVKKQ